MESTAINTVYVLVHIIEEERCRLDYTEEGYVWEVYFREDDAKRIANDLNKKFGKLNEKGPKGYYNKWIVLEKEIF